MRGFIVTIGDEITSGIIPDTNKVYIARKTEEMGVQIIEQRSIRDNVKSLCNTLDDLIPQADVIIFTGGLGPTFDDITAESVAQYLKCPLIKDLKALERIKKSYKKREKKEICQSFIQAMYPKNSQPLKNPLGLAVGFRLDFQSLKKVKKIKNLQGAAFFFPGVPCEMEKMVEIHLLPWVKNFAIKPKPRVNLFFFGMSESFLTARLKESFSKKEIEKYKFAVSFKDSIGNFRIIPRAGSKKVSSGEILKIEKKIENQFLNFILPKGCTTIAEAVHNLLIKKSLTLSIAESCTGGWLAKKLVDFPGASLYFKIGWIAYSNESKIEELGVKPGTLNRFGAVSEQCVQEMLTGAITRAKTDYALAVSGIAGPDGGTQEKPIGTVYLGLARKKNFFAKMATVENNYIYKIEKNTFSGNRNMIMIKSVQQALFILLNDLLFHGKN